MSALIRLLLLAIFSALALFGVKPRSFENLAHRRRHFSSVSRTISAVTDGRRYKLICASVMHGFLVFFTIVWIYFFRLKESKDSFDIMLPLFFVLAWVMIGPVLIWHYERFLIPLFLRNCKKFVNARAQYEVIRSIAYTPLHKDLVYISLIAIWMCLIVFGVYQNQNFVYKLGVTGTTDWIFPVLIIGAVIVGYYGSIGLCLQLKTFRCVLVCARATSLAGIHSHDKIFGLSYVKDFLNKSTMFLLSGWLFAPMLIMLARDNDSYSSVIILLTFYFILTMIAYFVPNHFVNLRIIGEHNKLKKKYAEKLDLQELIVSRTPSLKNYVALKYQEERYRHINEIGVKSVLRAGQLSYALKAISVPIITIAAKLFNPQYFEKAIKALLS
jgi:hypothetical protein